ncbi:ATP-binding protein [Natronogracilivirga saccharolytica]|uniref:histidine kinase n=1 Tax=Natronogracilivirga saccharolytica TaxID=2812953 RepID=A0A8J7SDC2_9BACT|nr:ATP-binding protein [Natronogracilivirga saccharolytica]MBP3193991.1 ATP-binding protein [Natronogracilivirga saccharolytica]
MAGERKRIRSQIGSNEPIAEDKIETLIPVVCVVVPNSQKILEFIMHIERKPSTVVTVLDRIYHPMAQNMGVSLLLRNKINSEVQFPARFFINLIQISGILVENAIKFSSPNGLVDVFFTLDSDEDHSTLNMTVTDSGKIITPDLVSAINRGNQTAQLPESDGEPGFGFRLGYAMQLVSEEDGRIFIKSETDSGTTFSLSFPLHQNYMNRRKDFHTNAKNSEALFNGSYSSRSHTFG